LVTITDTDVVRRMLKQESNEPWPTTPQDLYDKFTGKATEWRENGIAVTT